VDAGACRSVRDYVLWAEHEFEAAGLFFGHGTDSALDEAAWLVSSALRFDPEHLEERLDDTPTPDQREAIESLVAERIRTHKPLAYLLHEAWFAGHRFYVDERVIVPRSLIGEYILDDFQPWIDRNRVRDVLDLCTGSGCIAIAVAHAFMDAQVDAVDISADALSVAERNVRQHGLDDRVHLIQSDLFGAIPEKQYDVIVSNPPYVPDESMDRLPAEYGHEPDISLRAADQGLAIIARILREAVAHLKPGGILMVESGESREAVDQRWPRIPFTWLTHESGEETVFVLTREDLAAAEAQPR
jgi:ribosomal protein L3 glutamine methyltransferase